MHTWKEGLRVWRQCLRGVEEVVDVEEVVVLSSVVVVVVHVVGEVDVRSSGFGDDLVGE